MPKIVPNRTENPYPNVPLPAGASADIWGQWPQGRLASHCLTTEDASRGPVPLLPSGYRSSPFLPSRYFYLNALPPGDPTVMFRPSKLSAA
jgi:hypothetical protein